MQQQCNTRAGPVVRSISTSPRFARADLALSSRLTVHREINEPFHRRRRFDRREFWQCRTSMEVNEASTLFLSRIWRTSKPLSQAILNQGIRTILNVGHASRGSLGSQKCSSSSESSLHDPRFTDRCIAISRNEHNCYMLPDTATSCLSRSIPTPSIVWIMPIVTHVSNSPERLCRLFAYSDLHEW